MERQLKYSARTERDTVIVDVFGQIDMGNSPGLRKALLESLDRTERLGVNLTDVTYIDSSGIASLVEVLEGARNSEKTTHPLRVEPFRSSSATSDAPDRNL